MPVSYTLLAGTSPTVVNSAGDAKRESCKCQHFHSAGLVHESLDQSGHDNVLRIAGVAQVYLQSVM